MKDVERSISLDPGIKRRTGIRGQLVIPAPAHRECYSTGVDLVAAMQMSPYKEIVLQPTRGLLPVRDVAF